MIQDSSHQSCVLNYHEIIPKSGMSYPSTLASCRGCQQETSISSPTEFQSNSYCASNCCVTMHTKRSVSTHSERFVTNQPSQYILLRSGLTAGCAAALSLGLAKWPTTRLMQLQPPVLTQMGSYWLLRCALAPVVLLNMSISGILQVCIANESSTPI